MATIRSWNARFLWLLKIILFLLSVASDDTDEDLIPHFDFSQQGIYVLENSRPWVPGRTTTVTFGRADEPMQIHLGNLSGGEDSLYSRSKSCHLMFKCSSEDSEFQQIDLVNSSVSQHWYETDLLCEGKGKRKFKLQKLNGSVHSLTLLKADNISFEQSIKHLMEFRVRVEFSANTVNSSSLFIFSFDSALNVNAVQKTSGKYTYRRRILTEDAIQFLTGRIRLTSDPLMRVNFLDKRFVDLIVSAPPIIRSLLSVNVKVATIQPCTAAGCHSVSFTTDGAGENAFAFHNGAIYLTSDVHSAMQKLAGTTVRVDVRVSPGRFASFKSLTVMEFHLVYSYSPRNYPDECIVDGNGTEKSLTLFIGIENSIKIDCPVVCVRQRGHCTVYRDGIICNKQLSDKLPLKDQYEWLSCDGNGEIVRDGRMAAFELSRQASRTVVFKFVGSQSQMTSYNIRVAEMPLFSPSLKPGGSLPPVTYANLDTRVSFNCTVWHSYLNNVVMSAYVQLLNDTSALPGTRWRELTLQEFVVQILKLSPNAIDEKTSRSQFAQTLHVLLPHVTVDWKHLHFAIVCRVEVSRDDARRMLGLPHWETESRSHVVYSGRRLPLQGCRPVGMSETQLVLLLMLSAVVDQLSAL